MDFVGGTIYVFGSLPDIVVDSRNLGLAHPVRPHHPRAKPLRVVDQNMQRRPLDGNARSLQPGTQFGENIVNEALVARVVCQPVHNVAVRMRGDGIDFWWRVHSFLPSSDLDRRYGICRVPARRRQRSPATRLDVSLGRSPVGAISRAPAWHFCTRSGQTAGGTPLLEGFDVRVGEQQCAMRNVGLPRLVEHEAQYVLYLGLATAFNVTQHRRRVL